MTTMQEYIKELVQLSVQDLENIQKELVEVKNNTEISEHVRLLEIKFLLGQIYTISRYIYKLQEDLLSSVTDLLELGGNYGRKD